MPRLALVVQRYGPDIHGGSESAARQLAEQLTALAEVHVLTTCAHDYTTWANSYPAGEFELNGVTIHRFPVDIPRNWQQSQQQTGLFLLSNPTLAEQMAWIQREGPFSTPLLRHIQQHASQYDHFLFFTYVYATTFFGLPLVADKAILVPTAHDEPFLYLDAFRALFHLPRHIVYLTRAEQELVERVTGTAVSHHIAALGLVPPADVSADRFRQKYNLHEPFLFYGGRLAEAKNVPELITYFLNYRQQHPNQPLKLVLTGQPQFPLPNHPDVIPIGFVSEQDKFDGLQAATVVVMPSLFESLSIIILEAWLLGTAVLVNGRCAVTKQQVRQSNGGLYYHNQDEFNATLDRLLSSPELRQRLGENGRLFTTHTYSWPHILAVYQRILS
ncbi:MAG: glycosyltransferase family 4 protein [Ardenticatenaceae bacterium]|nr:glycosyltransferase family 4 protein [Ardenticatenaceae bacterium]